VAHKLITQKDRAAMKKVLRHIDAGKQSRLAAKNPYATVNPKDLMAMSKLDLTVVPESLVILAALGMLEGKFKYGQFNYRVKPVKMSVYVSALKRHTAAMQEGEWADPDTGVPHISYIACCTAIIGDAWLRGTLIDDRPPRNEGTIKLMRVTGPELARGLAKLFAGHNPIQWTAANEASGLVEARVETKRPAPKRAKRR